MSESINVGIDLGTTNSVVAVFEHGKVVVRKHNQTHKDTLSSAVMPKRDKLVVGDKAKDEAFGPRGDDVAVAFKRKMGTSERIRFRSTGQEFTPVELSAIVIKELRERHLQGDSLEAAVITVPASFDLTQSHATVEAGRLAGLKQVVNLQEPIAASLAYANAVDRATLPDQPWLVYDLGGGTFDVALISTTGGELKVIDHEGDNFLGGVDIDRLLVERFIFPYLEHEHGLEPGMLTEFTAARGRYRVFYSRFMQSAEAAKKELSASSAATIDDLQFGIYPNDPDDFDLPITRSEFEDCLRPIVDRTVDLINRLLTRNQLQSSDIAFVLMVGGSTYIPFVRRRVGERIGVDVQTDIDPITAIAEGAAYFAATRQKDLTHEMRTSNDSEPLVSVRVAYDRCSVDTKAILAGRVEGNRDGLSFRIERVDGGFDSGLKPLEAKFMEDLPLVADAFNIFRLRVVDSHGGTVAIDVGEICIAQGKFAVLGQPLTSDICLEYDDLGVGTTRLRQIFKRGTILPAKATALVEAAKAVSRGSKDCLRFSVYEGDETLPPLACKRLGELVISGFNLEKDARKGAAITCYLSLDESRTLTVAAEIEETDQFFSEVLRLDKIQVKTQDLRSDAENLQNQIDDAIETANAEESYERSQQLKTLQRRIAKVYQTAWDGPEEDTTDLPYKLDHERREIFQEFCRLESPGRIRHLADRLDESIDAAEAAVAENGSDLDRRRLEDVRQRADAAVLSEHPRELEAAIDDIDEIRYGIFWRSPQALVALYQNLVENEYSRFNDTELADVHIQAGRLAVENSDWMRLRDVNITLIQLLPEREQADISNRTGIRIPGK